MERSSKGRDRSGLARRTSREWAARGALALFFCFLGYLGTVSSLAIVIAKGAPASAYAMAPGNGVIMAEYAEKSFAEAPQMDATSFSARLARRALLADPTATEALTVLGMQAQLRGDTARSHQIFSYSTALSRRELRSRMWAIEKAAILGDVAGALRNYDIALRTSKDAPYILYPTLAAALSERRVRAELLPILASRPVWEEGFLDYAALSGVEPEGAVALFQEGQKIGLKVSEVMRVNLVNALALQDKPNRSWAYYSSFRTGVERGRSRDPNFALQTASRTVFDWQVGADSRLAAIFSRDEERGMLEFNVPPGLGGEVASQTQLLSAGTYRLEGRSRGLSQPERSQPYWTLVCSDGRELGRVAVPNSDQNDGRFSGRFIVPTGCPVQKLSLVVRPSEDIMGVSGQILRAQLARAMTGRGPIR